MSPDEIRSFAGRRWADLSALDEQHWLAEYRARGPVATFEASAALFEHMRDVRPDWPTDADRAADLAQHVAFRRLLDRAAHAFGAR